MTRYYQGIYDDGGGPVPINGTIAQASTNADAVREAWFYLAQQVMHMTREELELRFSTPALEARVKTILQGLDFDIREINAPTVV